MRKLFVKACIIGMLLAVLSAVSFAAVYEPDNDGLYSVSLELEAGGEYMLFAIKGEYDVTNYIEAFSAAADEDIIYFEQKTAPEDGNITFGPFAPRGYFDATLILIGTNYDQPVICGYLSAEGVSNRAKIDILGVEKKYIVEGKQSEDIVIDIDTRVYDSFGYESYILEQPVITLAGAKDGVTYENGKLVIAGDAQEQLFGITATIGDTKSIKYVEIERSAAVVKLVKIFESSDLNDAIDHLKLAGKAGSYPSVTFVAKSYDQFGDEIADTHRFSFNGETADSTITPTSSGTHSFYATSMADADVFVDVTVWVVEYENNSLALYQLIEKCNEELMLLDVEKFICDENGAGVFSPYKWTTNAKLIAFDTAVDEATKALEAYNGENDAEYAAKVTALQTAYNTYIASFKTGTRKDVTSMGFKQEAYSFPVSATWHDIAPSTVPRLSTTTDKITYVSSDAQIVEVNEDGEVKAKGNGTVTITATTRGGIVSVCTVTSYHGVTRITLNSSEYTAEYGKENTVAEAIINPNYYGDIMEWSLENGELAELVVEKTEKGEKATIIPKKSGSTKLTLKAVNSGVSKTATLTVVMPDWETVAAPAASAFGNVLKNTPVTLTSDTQDAVIHYTLDGTIPSKTNGRLYSVPIVVSQDFTIKAVAFKEGMFDSEVAVYEYNALDTAVSVSDAMAKAGTKANVYVSFADFADVKSARIEITYDSANLMLSNVVFAEEITLGQGEGTAAGKLIIDAALEEGQAFDAVAATLEFDVADTAEDGQYAIEVSADVLDINEGIRNTKTQNGIITVRDYVLGDANDDGKIGLEDVLIIKQYTADNASAKRDIFLAAADVNGDGVVDKNDSTLIAQYCVGLIDTFN